MKYGVVFFNETENLGDDIQTYTALRFLPSVDYIIEREKLSEFVPDKNELVSIIMNGWYVHDICSLPPSPFINPLVISAHFTDHLANKKPDYFDEYFYDFLKRVEPIGLRDRLVKQYLDDDGISTYFSGCMTLTIKPFKNIKKENKICLVDVDKDIEKKVSETTKCKIVKHTHNVNKERNMLLSFNERMKNVEDRLKEYQSCKLVITSRLHVALPCLSIGVPVLLIYDDKNIDVKNRLGEYTNYVNYISKKEFLKKPNYDIKNKDDFLKIRKGLEKRIKEFIDDSKNKKLSKNEDIVYYQKYFVGAKKHLHNMLKSTINNQQSRIKEFEKNYKNDVKYINKLQMQLKLYQIENQMRYDALFRYKNESDRYNQIVNSRSYKLYKIIKKPLGLIKRILRIKR